MSRVSFPVTRPIGRAMLVANPASRAHSLAILSGLGYTCAEADDVYAAFATLCEAGANFNAVILSLGSLYKEELQSILTIKRRFPQIEVWLSQADGRHASMIEAIRLGADGVLAEDGLHRIGMPAPEPETDPVSPVTTNGGPAVGREAKMQSVRPAGSNGSAKHNHPDDDRDHLDLDIPVGEPVLTADELRALLQEQPSAERDN
jgi:hypothetical protein